jgi:DNA polymerase-3 subunit epsilon
MTTSVEPTSVVPPPLPGEKTLVLTDVHWPTPQPLSEGAELVRACIIDVQTTGLSEDAEVIEVCIVPFTADKTTGHLASIGPAMSGLRGLDRPRDLDPAVTLRIGLCAQDLMGNQLPIEGFNKILAEVDLVVAFNARFDRQHASDDAVLPVLRGKFWGCVLDDVPWAAEGFHSLKLEMLLMLHARQFIDVPLRSEVLCTAVGALLGERLPDGQYPLKHIADSLKLPTFLFVLRDVALETNDALKSRGYRWFPGNQAARSPTDREKGWWRVVAGMAESDAEHEWIKASVYGRKRYETMKMRNIVRQLTCRQRHSKLL